MRKEIIKSAIAPSACWLALLGLLVAGFAFATKTETIELPPQFISSSSEAIGPAVSR